MMQHIFDEMRPKQWIKNTLLFFPLVFSGGLFDGVKLFAVISGFVALCAASSGMYIINDIFDRQHDQEHPIKKKRPIARGDMGIALAIFIAVGLVSFSLIVGFWLQLQFGSIVLCYLIMNVLYSRWLKHLIILDVLVLALFFIIRVIGGALLANVEASFWLLICTFMLATFLGFSKRRHELTLLEKGAPGHRQVLKSYDAYFLDQMIAVVTTSTLMSYILYTVSEETFLKFGTRNLLYTVPFVLYGVFRYLYLIHKKESGGDPVSVMVSDKGMIVNLIAWITTVVIIIYGG
jgi:4-hydroxybenzoate polyprenyltransferase